MRASGDPETRRWYSGTGGWLLWLGVLALATAGLLTVRDRLNEAHVALTYLLVVQGASAHKGRAVGFALAALAFFCLNWFFLPPYGTLIVAKPLDWFVLAAFLATSMVATQLLEWARAEATVARERAGEVRRLATHADALREEARIKDEVLASVSHDLRTPLTTIRAMAHDLAETGDERALIIEEEANRLNAFVADLLDFSRINSGTVSFTREPNEAEDLIGAALQRITGATNGREIRVSLDDGEPLLFGRFDFAQTLRALVNLLENALKYSPAGEPVELTVRREGPRLAFAVADRGPGVAPEERERIFAPFYRPPGVPPDVSGAGLGLSIARALMDAQGGSLEYEARPGGGSVFTVRVPAVDVDEVAGA
jgi:two-component system sensor histidine kinase KdpD